MINLKHKFECKKTYEELNEIIKDFLETRTENGSFKEKYGFQFEEFENLLLNHLYEKTNLKKELNTLQLSSKSIDLLGILKNINKDGNCFEDFLDLLNQKIDALKDSDFQKYSFLFALNLRELPHIEKIENIKEKPILRYIQENNELVKSFENILKFFDIKRFDKKNVHIKKEKDYNDLSVKEKVFKISSSYGGEVLIIEVNARDSEFAFNKVNSKFEAFLGFLSFVNNRFCLMRHDFYREEDFRMFKIEPKHIFIFTKDKAKNSRYDIPNSYAKNIMNDLKDLRLINYSNLKISEKNEDYAHFGSIMNSFNDELTNMLHTLFSLYYSATSEKMLGVSFLKFWIFSEYLIKKPSQKNDNQMLRVMKKIFKLHLNDPFLSKRIYFLHRKRNKMVHEGELNIITQEDRNLSKLIADCLLTFYLDSIPEFGLKKLIDFDFLINNIGKDMNTLSNHLQVIYKLQELVN